MGSVREAAGATPQDQGGRLERVGIAALAALALVLVWRTWMTWILPSQDVSREISLPWRISLGAHLYRDASSPLGPLATWAHAAAFRAFGPSLATPLLLLLPSAALAYASLYALARRLSPRAALAGTALAIVASVASPHGGALVYPYAFNAAHALALGAAGLFVATLPAGRLAGAVPLVSGLLWGAALSCKLELGIAALGAGLLATIRSRDLRLRGALSALVAVAVAALVYGLALRGVTLPPREGPFMFVGLPEEWRRLYRWIAGIDDPGASLASLAGGLTLLLGALGLLELMLRFLPGRIGLLVGCGAALAGAAVLTLSGAGQALDRELPVLLRAAPLVVSLAAASSFLRGEPPPAVALLAFGALASARVFLNFTYGSVATPYASLAAPPLLVATALLAFRLPRARRPAVALLLLGLLASQALRIWKLGDPAGWVEVDTPRGAFRLRPDQAAAVRGVLDYLGPRVRKGETLVGFPEVGLYRFLLDLRNPLRQEDFLPGNLTPETEAAAAAALEAAAPRFVLLQNQPFPAYGAVAFGRDYDRELWAAVERGWHLTAQFGYGEVGQPIGPGPFFVRVYERRDGPAEARK